MGLWNRIVQKMSKQTFKMVQERGNGFRCGACLYPPENKSHR